MSRQDEKQSASGSGSAKVLLLQLIVTLGLAWAAYNFFGQDRSPSPCGVPLPEIPQLVTNTGKDMEKISVAAGMIPENYLEFMAPQPDGVMPLRYPMEVFRSDFSLKLPMGTTNLPMGDSFFEDSIDSQVVFKWEQQLDYLKISIPGRQEGESVTDFVARARSDYEELGATFYADSEPLELEHMLFQHFEYRRMTKYSEEAQEMELSHYVYFGPAGVRVVILDFITTPDRHEAARPLVEKIMRSIDPGNRFLEQMSLEYPERFGYEPEPGSDPAGGTE